MGEGEDEGESPAGDPGWLPWMGEGEDEGGIKTHH